MNEPRKPTESCTVCGAEIKDGDRVYFTADGDINIDCPGCYSITEQDSFTVACEGCGEKISDLIVMLQRFPKKEHDDIVLYVP